MMPRVLSATILYLTLFTANALVSPAAAETCTLPPSGLIGWWDGDAVSGTTATDIHAGNDGMLVGDTATASGQVGDAFSFDGAGDYIQLPLDSGAIPNQFTIDAWVFPTKLTRFSFLQGIVDSDTTFPLGPRGVTLAVFGGIDFGGPDANPMQVIGVFHNPDETQYITGGFETTPNAWHHYALTYDGTQLCLYQDGTQETCVPAAGPVIDNNVNFRIGHGQADNASQRFFGGKIDEVEIFDRALSASEIQAIFDAGSAGKCKVDPVALLLEIVQTGGTIDDLLTGLDPNEDPGADKVAQARDKVLDAVAELAAGNPVAALDNSLKGAIANLLAALDDPGAVDVIGIERLIEEILDIARLIAVGFLDEVLSTCGACDPADNAQPDQVCEAQASFDQADEARDPTSPDFDLEASASLYGASVDEAQQASAQCE